MNNIAIGILEHLVNIADRPEHMFGEEGEPTEEWNELIAEARLLLKRRSGANELYRLQASRNDGRGVDCVRTIVVYLRRGEFARASACCFDENDKIVSYPEILTELRSIFPAYDQFHSQ